MSESQRQLTEEQKFAFCLAANIPMRTESRVENGKAIVKWTTLNPCAVVEVEPGRFTVFTKPHLFT